MQDDRLGQPRHQHLLAPAGHDRDPGAVPGDRRAGVRGDDLRALSRHAARVLRREAARGHVRPLKPRRLADRDLDPDLLPRDHPQVHLLGEARLASERRPPGRADRRAAPDGVLRPRRDRDGELERCLGRDQAPDPARDRARLDPARDHRADHARLRARRPERGLRAHRAREGDVAGDRRPAPRDAQRAPAGRDDHRPPGRPAARRRRAHRDGLRDPGHGLVARPGDLQPRLPGDPGRRPLPRDRVRVRQPDRGHLVRVPQPEDPASRERSPRLEARAELAGLRLTLARPAGSGTRPGGGSATTAARSSASSSSAAFVARGDPRAVDRALRAARPEPRPDHERLLPRPVVGALVRRRPARPRRAVADPLGRALLAPDRRRRRSPSGSRRGHARLDRGLLRRRRSTT